MSGQEAEASGFRRRHGSSLLIGCWSSARQTKPFDGAWGRAKVDQKDLDEHRNSWPSWRQFRPGEERRTDDERERCGDSGDVRRSKALERASISRIGTTTLRDSRSGPRVDCWMQQGKQHEDEWKLNTDGNAIFHSNVRMTHQNSQRSYSIHSRINAYTISSCKGVRV